MIKIFLGIIIPFIGTILGSSMVFIMKNKINEKVEKLLLGFASGIMIAASIWSLLIPAIEMSIEQNKISWMQATIGFILGILFLMLLDYVIPFLKLKKVNKKNRKTAMMVLAVTIHNIPEGMAVGVAFAGVLLGNSIVTLAGAFALAIGIGIQNIPEGTIVSMPLKSIGVKKKKAFLYGTLSGVVEPIAALITILLIKLVVPILPLLLAFAAGAMIYVVVNELIPESQIGKNKNMGTIGLTLGFVIMMILDVAL